MRFSVYMLLVAVLWGITPLKAQEPAVMRCTEVNLNGAVTLHWSIPTNTTDFERYHIFYSTDGSTFSLIESIDNALTNNYFHADASANTGTRFYYVEIQNVSENILSDTIATIYLQLDNPGFNTAQLFWNALSDPLPEGSSGNYKILREFPPGNWEQVTSTDNLQYEGPVIVCNDSVNFRIEMENISGCRSVSNTTGARFKILDEPEKPVIDSISTNVEGHAVIGWASVSNAQSYIVYRLESGIWLPLDTLQNADNTFYEDTLFDACGSSTSWSVATIDTCGNTGPKDELEIRRNIRIREARYDPCGETVSLAWDNYRGPVADTYEIWAAENDSEFVLIGTNQQMDTTFDHKIVNIGSEYTFFVRAKFSSGTSTTCKESVETFIYDVPQEIYFANASVLSDNHVELTVHVDTNVSASTWEIWRTEPSGSNFSKIDSIDSQELEGFPLSYIDSTADASEGFYRYEVIVLDSCGNRALESNELKTIYLTVLSLNEDQNLLQWDAFEGWEGEVGKYYIYRMINGQEPALPIDSVAANTFEYTDDFSSISNLQGGIIYWVQAAEKDTNSYGYLEKSYSNRTGLPVESDMYVANAFRPMGFTPEFRPVFRFYNGKNYLFQIFNRWGEMIFESRDPYTGWDGRFNGDLVPTGTYAYRLIYQKLDDSNVIKTGSVTVVY